MVLYFAQKINQPPRNS